jgi:hypothetical protein
MSGERRDDEGDIYSVSLVGRNEAVEYRDRFGQYHFDIGHEGKQWVILLPGSKGADYQPHELTPDEERRIVPRLKKYLSRIWWLGIVPRSYTVDVRRDEGWSVEEYLRRLERDGHVLERREDGSVLYIPPKRTMGARLRLLVQILRNIGGA